MEKKHFAVRARAQNAMKETEYPIPYHLNMCVAVVQLTCLVFFFWLCGQVSSGWAIIIVSFLYGVTMNSAYSIIHEAEHNLFHPNNKVNTIAGVLMALFFPAPYHLLRQGHIGHHLRNRSDDEAFDYYFEGDNPMWRKIYWYGIITGIFWIVVACSNFMAIFTPSILQPKPGRFARPTEAVVESFNPKYMRLIKLEALMVFVLHGTLLYTFSVPILNYLVMMFGFGFMWSAMQYVHHYNTLRDVREGARNLKTFKLIDLVWLNHNYHLNHHMRPTIPWLYLPALYEGTQFKRTSLVLAYLKMWRGPRYTANRVKNLYAGKVIK